jgi:3-methylcrotonyl-CoA carboxylase alpha subunit
VAAVIRIGPSAYRVDTDGKQSIVYVGGSEGHLWAFCDGHVYRQQEPAAKQSGPLGTTSLTAPMPATVVKVLVTPGQAVRHGDTLVVLEAMKMELPIRAPGDGVVKAVNCHEGELVQPDRALVELE